MRCLNGGRMNKVCVCNLRRWFGNLFWGMQFRTCEKFRVFADSKSSLTPEIFHKYKSHTAITSIVASLRSQILRIAIRIANRLRIKRNLVPSLRGRIVDSHEAIHNKNKSCDSTHRISPDSWCKKSE